MIQMQITLQGGGGKRPIKSRVSAAADSTDPINRIATRSDKIENAAPKDR